jgi:hypothetical protein
MVGGLGALGALGSIGGGLAQGADAEARRKLLALQAQQLIQQQAGQGDAGAALMSQSGVSPPTSVVPGAQPMGGLLGGLKGLLSGGQAPASGAPPPAPLGVRGGGGAPQPPSTGGAPPQGQPQGAPPPQAQAAVQRMDFPTLTNTLARQPGMTPQRLMAALSALAPYMNMQAQIDYKQAMMRVAQQNAGSNAVRADAAKETADTGAVVKPGELQEKKDRDVGLDANRKARLAIEQQKLKDSEDKRASDEGIKTLSQWQSANKDAENERQRAVTDLNAAYSNTADPDREATVEMLKRNLSDANDRIKALHDKRPNVADDVGEGAHPTGNAGAGGKSDARVPVKVQTPEEAAKLPLGTPYVTPDGQSFTR